MSRLPPPTGRSSDSHARPTGRGGPPLRRPPRRGAWALGVFLLLAGALVLALALMAPRVAASMATARLERATSTLLGRVEHGEVSVSGFSTVRLDRLRWVDSVDFEAEARDVEVEVEPFAAVFGGPAVRSVHVKEVLFRLGTPDAPLSGPEDAVRRLAALVRQGKGGGGIESTGRHAQLPDIGVDRVEGRIGLATGAIAVTGGTLSLALPPGSLDASDRALRASATVRAGDGVERRVEVRADLTGLHPESFEVRTSPSLAFELGPVTLGAGGLSWRPNELTLIAPGWDRSGRASIVAESVTLRWNDVPGGSEALAAMLPSRTPGLVRRLLESRSVVEVEVNRPTLDLVLAELPPPPPAAETTETPDETPAPKEGAFRRSITRAWAGAGVAIASAARAVADLGRRLPAPRISVHGATVRYLEPGTNPADPATSLANLDMSITRAPGAAAITGAVTFECPEAPARANEVRFTIDPETAAMKGSLRAARLPLTPYRGVLPKWLRPGPRTTLHDTDVALALTAPEGRLTVQGTVGLADATLVLPAVAAVPMTGVDIEVQGSLDVDIGAGKVELSGGRFTIGQVRMPVEVVAESLASSPRIRLKASVDRVKAQDLLDSLPREAIPALEGVRLSGSFAAQLDLDIDTRDLSAMKLDFRPDVADLVALDLGRGVNLDLLRKHFFHRIEEGGGKVISRVIGPSSPDWIPYHEVPKALIDALTTSEDSQFFSHHGFSVAGIRRSLQVNLERGGFYQGASTLSQQLVKNLFLSHEKTIARKLQEVFITWQLEKFLDKEKILELYLNVIEWGPEVYGLRQAAMHYFGKLPQELDLLECAYLVSVIPNPRMFHVHFERGALSPAFEARVKGLVREMARRGVVTQAEADAVRDRALKFVPLAPPPPSNEGLGLEPPGPPPPPPEYE